MSTTLTIQTLFRCAACHWYIQCEPEPQCGYFDLPLIEVARPQCTNFEEEVFSCGTLPS